MPIESKFKMKTTLAALAIGLTFMGCSRPNTIYPGDPKAATSDEPIAVDPIVLPSGFYDQSVNRASATIVENNGTHILRLQTSSGLNTISGGFNGPGLGNRALIGISLYEGFPVDVAARQTLEVASSTASSPQLLLVVDLECDGTQKHVLVGEPSSLASETYSSIQFDASFPNWKVSGSSLIDSETSAIILPGTDTPHAAMSLDEFTNAYRLACIANAYTGDPGLPRSLPTAGVLLSLGNADNSIEQELDIRSWEIDTDLYETWVTP